MSDAAERYIALVKQLGEAQGKRRGWQTDVAKRLGVHRSFISRVVRGDRSGVSSGVIEKAIFGLNLQPDFFYAETHGAPHYRTYMNPAIAIEALPIAITEPVLKFGDGKAEPDDLYALARAVLDLPFVRHAQAMLAGKPHKTAPEIGSLYVVAEKLIGSLNSELKYFASTSPHVKPAGKET